MNKKSKILLEVEMLSRTHGFKSLREMLNSSDIDTVKLAIGIIEAKGKYPLLTEELEDCLSTEIKMSCPIFNIFNYLGPDVSDIEFWNNPTSWNTLEHFKLLKIKGI